jgi:hypothetical protein
MNACAVAVRGRAGKLAGVDAVVAAPAKLAKRCRRKPPRPKQPA